MTQVDMFFDQVTAFERHLAESGIRLFKLWFTVSRTEQLRRFEAPRTDPLKQWKLSPTDEASIERFVEYGAARDGMLRRTEVRHAPGTVAQAKSQTAPRTSIEASPPRRLRGPAIASVASGG